MGSNSPPQKPVPYQLSPLHSSVSPIIISWPPWDIDSDGCPFLRLIDGNVSASWDRPPLELTSHFSAQSTVDPLSHPLAGRSKPMNESGSVEVTSHCLCVASCNHDLTAIFVHADINVCRTLNDFFPTLRPPLHCWVPDSACALISPSLLIGQQSPTFYNLSPFRLTCTFFLVLTTDHWT